MMYVDLDELPALFDRFWLWSARRFNVAWFRRQDHLGDKGVSLSDALRDHVEVVAGTRPTGPVRLLTHFRYFGYGFNPVSFYFCFDEEGDRVEAVVCEVNNTPWGEQYVYVLPREDDQGVNGHLRFQRDKRFHVSPFMPMDMHYDWRFLEPKELLNVHMENYRENEKVFDATLTLSRQPISSRTLAMVLIRYPLVTLKVTSAIYFEALRLWLKRTPVHSHPDNKNSAGEVKGA
jgi:DUF1365 family protein